MNLDASPGELSQELLLLADEYSKKTDELDVILATKSYAWPLLREKATSDKQADKAWDNSTEGRQETSLRLKLKALEKLMSAIRTHLRIKGIEAQNQL